MTKKTNDPGVVQLTSLASVALLAPALRIIPQVNTQLAGHLSWLSPLFAIPIILLIVALVGAFMKFQRPGEGLGAAILRALGKPVGSAVLAIYALWLLLYAGFLLRSGANRFTSTIYPNTNSAIFICITLLLCLVSTLGNVKPLARCAEIFRPLLFAVLAFVIFFSIFELDPASLLPVTGQGLLKAGVGAAPVINVVGSILVLIGYPIGVSKKSELPWDTKRMAKWSVKACIFLSLLTAIIVGTSNMELTLNNSRPFFILIRNLNIFGLAEHIEAPITALWLFPDFILVSLTLFVAAATLRLILGKQETEDRPKITDFKNGRWIIPLCAAIALVTGLVLPDSDFALKHISEVIVPIVSTSVSCGMLFLIYIIGKIRKKI